ncbi:MAG TPA: 16S rRNA (uracil(1498)-N(3))-methyltransferase [Alphaproteobacteria bacterium]|nr:16S rRNA (uracil(1498)-N(3))-methyltransferase [Alphaproteobacteria bacterium]
MSEQDHIRSHRTPRLHVDAALTPDTIVQLGPEQTHYLLRVMRLSLNAEVTVFNGRDGLWSARLHGSDRRRIAVKVLGQIAPQPPVYGPWLAFGVPKRQALEMIVQKGTELGVTRFFPIATEHAMAERLNPARLERIAIEASEQCERLHVPSMDGVMSLQQLLDGWPADRTLFWGDETGRGEPLADAADAILGEDLEAAPPPWGLMIGPEGGFAPAELDGLDEVPFLKRVTLGPRILRAETAVIAGLAIGQALAGDGDLPVRSAS